jgi:phytoene synthase
MARIPTALEEPYRSRAIPAGSPRYWSWLFAARESRDPLLGIYALAAEWHALMDPVTEPGVAQLKMAWWREELERWWSGSPVHPITRWLAEIPGAMPSDASPLRQSLEAAAVHAAGTPLERAADLETHAAALYGAPLVAAARLAGSPAGSLLDCTNALACGQYLTVAVAVYAGEARAGRTPFAVDELLAAGIDHEALSAPVPPPLLQEYLGRLLGRAAGYFASAATALRREDRQGLRHLLVLAELGARNLNPPRRSREHVSLRDLYHAWNAARRATLARGHD